MKKCLKCKSPIPTKMLVDGKIHWTNKRKYCVDCSPIGIHNTRPIGRPRRVGFKFCTKCNTELPASNFYIKKNGSLFAYCKGCMAVLTKNIAHNNKLKSIEYKGGKCKVCGYSKCVDALEFHHRDPSKKDQISMSRSFERIKPELDKCDLLCSNCHREEHAMINRERLLST